MIVTPSAGGRLKIITQIDHARFAADLLSLWISDGLPEHERREDLLFAVREHDNGWREKDSAPILDPEAGDRPYDFVTMPADVRSELWRVGCQRFREDRAYASLLIVEHDRHLHAQDANEAYRELLHWLDEIRSELIIATAAQEDLLAADYHFLGLTDFISLVACSDWTEEFESRGTTIAIRNSCVHLDPFPLAGNTTFRIPQRTIPLRSYRNTVDLATELATARWHWGEIKVRS